MKVISSTSTSQDRILKGTIKVLRSKGLVIFPSDTVYGLLVDATNEQAVQKLLEFKNRPAGKPISVFITWKMLPQVVKVDDPILKRLHELLPGPYTIVFPSRHKTSVRLESEEKTLGVRIPDHNLIKRLMAQFDRPITATSANPSGRSPHYSISSLLNVLSKKKQGLIDLIVDVGTLPRNKPSTVVDMTKETVKILRKGDVLLPEKKIYISQSEIQTKKIAKGLTKKLLTNDQDEPIALILKGDLGSGKTIFVKGIGEYFGVKNIISPTYVVMYEYPVAHGYLKKLIHFDLYTITSAQEYKYLGINNLLKKENLLCFEWGEKAGDILPLLRKVSRIITIQMEHINKSKRKITIKF